jgi:hypothetical protein
MARPTDLTPDVHARIVETVRLGNFRETAAAAAGVDVRTMRRWLYRGAQGEAPYAAFSADLDAAEAASEIADIGAIAAADDWKAIAWRRERMSNRWQLRLRVEVTKELDSLLDSLEAEFANEPGIYERILAIAAGSAGAGAAREASGHGPADGSG